MMVKVWTSVDVYSQLFLHAVKHAHCPCLGFIIGNKSDNTDVIVTDIVAICHSNPTDVVLGLATDIVSINSKTINNNLS